jgi:hypothetical protein
MIGKTNNPQIARLSGLHTADSTVFPYVAPDQVPVEKLPRGTYLQYVGFGHAGSVRQYYFRRISRGEQPKEFVVNADLSLLAKHRVAIQEGPALCLHLLLERGDVSGAPAAPTPRSLTESDMLDHLARRPAPRHRADSSRRSFKQP